MFTESVYLDLPRSWLIPSYYETIQLFYVIIKKYHEVPPLIKLFKILKNYKIINWKVKIRIKMKTKINQVLIIKNTNKKNNYCNEAIKKITSAWAKLITGTLHDNKIRRVTR